MPAGFVGRTAEVRALAGFVRRAGEAPAPAVALVYGQPGEGKTRLLSELCDSMPTLARVRVNGHELESAVPMAAVRDFVRRLSAGPEGSLVERLLSTSSAAPIELFQLFEASFRAVRAHGRLAVVVDDLQWVDPTSIALLHYLIRAAETAPCSLTVVAAGRPTGASTRLAHSVARVLADPDRLLVMELGPLDRVAGIRLARELTPGLDEPAAARMWERARGSPFWIETLAREWGGDGAGGLFGFRLRALSGDAATLLAVLAAAGRPLDRPAIGGIEAWPLDRAGRGR